MTLGIYGTGGLGRELLELAQQVNQKVNRWENIIFIDDAEKTNYVQKVEVFTFDIVKEKYRIPDIEIVIAVGEPETRRLLREKLSDTGYMLAVLVHPNVFIPDTTKLCRGAVICTNCFISCNVDIGENVLIQPNACVGHDSKISRDTVISGNVCIAGGCSIGSETYIGMQVPIKENTKIGSQSIIGMGSVVSKDIPDLVVAVGNPARPMKYNEEHKVFKKKSAEESS